MWIFTFGCLPKGCGSTLGGLAWPNLFSSSLAEGILKGLPLPGEGRRGTLILPLGNDGVLNWGKVAAGAGVLTSTGSDGSLTSGSATGGAGTLTSMSGKENCAMAGRLV